MADPMKEAFDLVADSDDWRNSIDTTIAPEDLSRCTEAVSFYTGTELYEVELCKDGRIRVAADGYRMGPCGP